MASQKLQRSLEEIKDIILCKIFLVSLTGTGPNNPSSLVYIELTVVEILSESPGEHGGYKEIIARIAGQGAYSRLKFESGAHRVQRVPETESQGRIHTSAATVAILPEADEIDPVEINLLQEMSLEPPEKFVSSHEDQAGGGEEQDEGKQPSSRFFLFLLLLGLCHPGRSSRPGRSTGSDL